MTTFEPHKDIPFIKIDTPAAFEAFANCVLWDHAHLREFYALSPSYYPPGMPGRLVAPDAPVNIALVILTHDRDHPAAVELKLERVESSAVSFDHDIEPTGRVHPYREAVELRLCHGCEFTAAVVHYRVLPPEAAGDRVRYGNYWDWLFTDGRLE